MSFGEPLALLSLLVLLPVVGVSAYASWRRRQADAAYGGSPALRRGASRWRTLLRGALLLGAVVLVALAVARPQWGSVETPLARRGIDVVIALDISRSMAVADVEPTRAEAAAAGLQDMLTHLRGDRVGLVTFGGSAFARSPLTLDLNAIAYLVDRAQGERALVETGSDLGEAINLSLQVLDVEDRAETRAVVLVTDGEDVGDSLDDAVTRAQREDVRIYTVTVGTEQGAELPPLDDTPSGPETGVSSADPARMASIAEQTNGSTREAGNMAGLAVEFAQLRQTGFDEEALRVPIERFQWFLGGAVALLLAQWLVAEGRRVRPLRVARRRAFALTGMLPALLAAVLLAGCGGTAAYQKVQQGNEAYSEGRYEEALAAYEEAKELLPSDAIVDYNIGNVLHRLERYEEATTASLAAQAAAAEDDDLYTRSSYAVGNHAFERNAMEEARDAYIAALLRDPTDDDAKHNLELVLRALQPPDQPPGENGEGEPGPGPADPGASPTPGTGEGETPGDQQPPEVPTPATPQPGATPQGGQAQPGGGQAEPGSPGDPEGQTLEEILDALLADGLTLEEALELLDRLRQESESNLEPSGPRGGQGLPDR